MSEGTRTPRSGQDSAPRSKSRHAPKASFSDLATLLPALLVAWFVASLTSASRWADGMLRRMGLAKHDAEDVRQDALVVTFLYSDRFAPPLEEDLDVALRKLFYAIALNLVRTLRRRRSTRREAPLRDDPPPDALIHPGHAGQVEALDVLVALEAATTAERWRAWFAFEVEGRTAREIAEREGSSVSEVDFRIRSARDDFATVLGRRAASTRSRGDR